VVLSLPSDFTFASMPQLDNIDGFAKSSLPRAEPGGYIVVANHGGYVTLPSGVHGPGNKDIQVLHGFKLGQTTAIIPVIEGLTTTEMRVALRGYFLFPKCDKPTVEAEETKIADCKAPADFDFNATLTGTIVLGAEDISTLKIQKLSVAFSRINGSFAASIYGAGKLSLPFMSDTAKVHVEVMGHYNEAQMVFGALGIANLGSKWGNIVAQLKYEKFRGEAYRNVKSRYMAAVQITGIKLNEFSWLQKYPSLTKLGTISGYVVLANYKGVGIGRDATAQFYHGMSMLGRLATTSESAIAALGRGQALPSFTVEAHIQAKSNEQPEGAYSFLGEWTASFSLRQGVIQLRSVSWTYTSGLQMEHFSPLILIAKRLRHLRTPPNTAQMVT
jgi:hypothetical protein